MGKPGARATYLAYALLLFGVFTYFMPAATWGPVSRLGLTRAVVERGVLDVTPWVDATGDRAHREGHWYTDKAPVPSFLAVPAYFIDHAWDSLHGASPQFMTTSTPDMPARHVTVNDSFARSLYVCSVSTAALAGVAASLLVLVWLRRRFSANAALAASLCMALGTPLFPYSTSFYGHAIAAAFLVGGFVLLTCDAPGRGSVRVAGLLLLLAVGCEYIVALPAAVLVLAVMVRARRDAPRIGLDLALGGLLPAIAIGAYHIACFGSPFATGYAFLSRAEFAEGHARGLVGVGLPKAGAVVGLLAGPRRGLFLLAPVAMVGAVGLAVRAAKGSFDERLAALLTVVLLLANSGYYMWWGGAATGPRHLVPVVPFLALGVAWAWQYRWLRWITIVAAVVSFANMLAFTAVGLEAPEHGNSLVDYAWRGLLAGRVAHLSGASNLGIRLGLPRDLSLAPLLVWVVLGLRYLIWGPVGPAGDQLLDEGVSSSASADGASAALLSCGVVESPTEVSVPVAPSSSVPNTRSSLPHATKVVAATTTAASTTTPRGKCDT